MAAGLLHGFAGALVSAAVSVEAAVAVEADLGTGGRFKLALNCRKEGYYAKRRWYRPCRPGTRYRPRQRTRPWQRQNGWAVRSRTGRKLYMPEMRSSNPSCRRPALQCKKLSKMWYENDKSLILVSKGDLICHAEMEQDHSVKV